MLFKNILVPYDGSSFATHAFKVAMDIAKKYDSKISVVTCLEIEFRSRWYIDSRIGNSLAKQEKDATQKYISKLESIAKKAKIQFNSKIIRTKSTVKTLVDYAKSQKIDLIIMGSHGRKGFDKMLLGSVANGVSQKVRCPVLIIK